MTIKFRSDAAGGAILNESGVEVLKVDASGRVTFDAFGGLDATGDFKFSARAAAPAGWIVANGQTIGNVGSGATRASAETISLFTLWWTDYTDAQLPILTSAGGASTRGASAAADWTAGKRLTVFDMTDDRFPVGANGTTTINGTKYADQMQGHFHVGSANVSGATGSPFTSLVTGGGPGSAETLSTRGFTANTMVSDGANGAPRVGTKTLPPRLGMLPLFKL